MNNIRSMRDTLRALAPQREPTPETVNDRVARYQLFQDKLNPKTDVVYHPCSGLDVSPSKAFLPSRVIYADINGPQMAALRKAGYEAHEVSALEFVPDAPVDVVILINPFIPPEKPADTVAPGGYVLCNGYHGMPNTLNENPDFTLVGVLHHDAANNDNFFDDEKLEDYWAEVETDEEFKAATPGSTAMRYTEAAILVQSLMGRADNILANYKALIIQVKAEKAEQKRKKLETIKAILPQATLPEHEDSELEEDPNILTYMPDGATASVHLDIRLPKKKGAFNDIFVFQRVEKEE